MKKTSRLAIRKMRSNLFLVIATSILVMVGVGFFVTLFTITQRYGETADIYFNDYNYADCTFYGGFTDDDVLALSSADGVTKAMGRSVKDYRNGKKTIRAISLTNGVNDLYFYSGKAPQKTSECVMIKKCADAIGIAIGDYVTVNNKQVRVSGLVASPEYIYLVKNERSIMTEPTSFGVVFTSSSFFDSDYNEIVIMATGEIDSQKLAGLIDADNAIIQSEQLNYLAYIGDIDEIRTFAYIFPGIFALLIIAVVYVILKRMAVKERKTIAVLKALGAGNRDILVIYLGQFLIAFVIAALLGCVATTFIVNIILGLFSAMFSLPLLGYHFYPLLWLYSILTAIVLCIIPGVLSLLPSLRVRPCEGMRPQDGRGGKKILLERISFIWKRLSFNTRYTLKSMLRSKGRFFAIIFGIMATAALLTLSFGFNNSIDNVSANYFDSFANYDMTVSFNPLPLDMDIPFKNQLDSDTSYSKVLQFREKINDENCTVTIVEKDFDKLNIDTSLLSDGIIISTYHANFWNVKTGETIKIGNSIYKVNAINYQSVAPSIYVSFDYFKEINGEEAQIYNTVYLRGGDTNNLREYLNQNDITYMTTNDDRINFESVLESVSTLIAFMVACAIVLGIAVLYAVGLLNISARESEYMLMQTLGYKRSKIMLSNIKETIIQILISLPLGMLLGIGLINLIKGQFTSSNYVVVAKVYPISYILTSVIVITIATLTMFITAHRINKLNITEGLKEQE